MLPSERNIPSNNISNVSNNVDNISKNDLEFPSNSASNNISTNSQNFKNKESGESDEKFGFLSFLGILSLLSFGVIGIAVLVILLTICIIDPSSKAYTFKILRVVASIYLSLFLSALLLFGPCLLGILLS